MSSNANLSVFEMLTISVAMPSFTCRNLMRF
jgi:hypothetical protein